MAQVFLDGWRPGLQKISLTKLIRAQAGLGLADAKDCVDRCLEGEVVEIPMPTIAAAEEFARAAQDLGAIVRVEYIEKQRVQL